jgi:Putative transposase
MSSSPPARPRGTRAAQQTSRLRSAVPSECGDAPRGRPHTEAPRRRARLSEHPPPTWGQTLLHHPHVHCVVPAGGLSRDGTRWVHARPSFFLPVKVLSRVFRGKFVAGLLEAFCTGALVLPNDLQRLTHEYAFRAWLRTFFRHDSVVYAKPPFGGPRAALSCAIHPSGRDLQPSARRRQPGPPDIIKLTQSQVAQPQRMRLFSNAQTLVRVCSMLWWVRSSRTMISDL